MGDFFKNHGSQTPSQRPLNFSGSHKPSPPSSGNYSRGYDQRFTQPNVEAFRKQPHVENQSAIDSRPTVSGEMFFLQIHNSYIVTETEEGFVIIDQHALHERIIYEDLRSRISDGKLQSQRLLIPETFEITQS